MPSLSGPRRRRRTISSRPIASTTGRAASAPTSPDYVEPSPKPHEFDFHEMLSSLADYPLLLRRLGIVIDLVVDLPSAEVLRSASCAWCGGGPAGAPASLSRDAL